VTILKMWRFMAAELNPSLGRPRLSDPKMVLRVRAGCVPIRTVMIPKTFIEKRASADSNETISITHSVECKEVQVLLVSSMTFPSLWTLPSGGQRLPRSQVNPSLHVLPLSPFFDSILLVQTDRFQVAAMQN